MRRMYLLSTETLETKRIPNVQIALNKVCPRSPTTASISHTGVFERRDEAVLYSLPLPGGKPKMISPFRAFPTGLTWSADDEKLIYSLFLGNELSELIQLGEVTVANGSVKQLVLAGSAQLPDCFVLRATNLLIALFP